MTDPKATRRLAPTPTWLIYGLLVAEGLLWLSERFQWFSFNEKKGWTVLICVALVGVTMLVMLVWFVLAFVCRWRFQFSIRSLLVLVVAVALPCSWLTVELKKARERHAAVEKWEEAGCVTLYKIKERGAEPAAPAWLRRLTGNEFFADAIPTRPGQSSDSGISHRQLLIDGWTRGSILGP